MEISIVIAKNIAQTREENFFIILASASRIQILPKGLLFDGYFYDLYFTITPPQNQPFMNKYPPRIAGGISFSGIALILLAAHKCAVGWPASHA